MEWTNCCKNEDDDIHIHIPAFIDQSAFSNNSSKTFIPSTHDIHRFPRVKKQATECHAKSWIQPSSRSWIITASIHGKPVCPWIKCIVIFLVHSKFLPKWFVWFNRLQLTFAHLANASGFFSHFICTQIGLPFIRSNFLFFVAAQ